MVTVQFAGAEELKKPTIRYGAQCLGNYGHRRKMMTISEAYKALQSFFSLKGFDISITDHSSRFIKAKVYKDKKHVDTIVLDLKTARMRSIYY